MRTNLKVTKPKMEEFFFYLRICGYRYEIGIQEDSSMLLTFLIQKLQAAKSQIVSSRSQPTRNAANYVKPMTNFLDMIMLGASFEPLQLGDSITTLIQRELEIILETKNNNILNSDLRYDTARF